MRDKVYGHRNLTGVTVIKYICISCADEVLDLIDTQPTYELMILIFLHGWNSTSDLLLPPTLISC